MDFIETTIKDILGAGAKGQIATLAAKVILAIFILWIGSFLVKWICRLVRKTLQKTNVDQGVAGLLNSVIRIVFYLVLFMMILNGFGYSTSSLLAILGSLGLAIALSLQDRLANLSAGVLIFILKPFSVGDYIIEDTNHEEGTVKEINLFFTKITPINGSVIIIPNSLLLGNSLKNLSVQSYRMLDQTCCVPYQTDIRKIKRLAREVIANDPCLVDPDSINVFVKELGETSIVLGLRAKVKTENYWTMNASVLENLQMRMQEEGIELGRSSLSILLNKEGE